MSRNCWEIFFCGREPHGFNAEKDGVCPAALESAHHGKNNGKNSGRYCWHVAGTLCGGEPEGIEAKTIGSCTKCKFYAHVQKQEGTSFSP
jgi:hypothetical protein